MYRSISLRCSLVNISSRCPVIQKQNTLQQQQQQRKNTYFNYSISFTKPLLVVQEWFSRIKTYHDRNIEEWTCDFSWPVAVAALQRREIVNGSPQCIGRFFFRDSLCIVDLHRRHYLLELLLLEELIWYHYVQISATRIELQKIKLSFIVIGKYITTCRKIQN